MREDALKREEPRSKPDSAPPRKPYRDPEFRVERVFETMGIAAAQVSPTQKHCRLIRKSPSARTAANSETRSSSWHPLIRRASPPVE